MDKKIVDINSSLQMSMSRYDEECLRDGFDWI